jgi:hypothetical protein
MHTVPHRLRSPLAAVLGLALLLPACQVGPNALKVSSSHYSDAVRVANSREILVNLVRLRYRDLPVFLAVSNISTQFEFGANASVSGSIPEGGGGSVLGLGAGVDYAEKPTLTFGIMGGEAFQKRMLTPIPVVLVSLLAESGWRGDRVFRITVEGINTVPNGPTTSGPTPDLAPDYNRFEEAIALLGDLTRNGYAKFEIETTYTTISDPIPADQIEAADFVDAARVGAEWFRTETGDAYQLSLEERRLVIRFSPDADRSPDLQKLRALLRLREDAQRYEFTNLDDLELDPFTSAATANSISLDTRSVMGVLYYLSNGIDIPQEHLDAGLVTRTLNPDGTEFDWQQMLGEVIRIRSSREEPAGVAVKVQHRGYWFYIPDDDLNSASTFSLLSQIFSLLAGDIETEGPVLTLPVGG